MKHRIVILIAAVLCVVTAVAAGPANHHPDYGSWYWTKSEGYAWFSFAGAAYTEDRRGIARQVMDEGWPAWMETSIGLADMMGADRIMVHLPFGRSPPGEPMRFDAYNLIARDARFARVVDMQGILTAADMHYERFGRPWVWYYGAIHQVGTSYAEAMAALAPVLAARGRIAVVIDAAGPNGPHTVDGRIGDELRRLGIDVGVEAGAHVGTGWLRPDVPKFIIDSTFERWRREQWPAWAPQWQQGQIVLLVTTQQRTHDTQTLRNQIRLGHGLAVGPWEHAHRRLDWTFADLLADPATNPRLDDSDDEGGR